MVNAKMKAIMVDLKSAQILRLNVSFCSAACTATQHRQIQIKFNCRTTISNLLLHK